MAVAEQYTPELRSYVGALFQAQEALFARIQQETEAHGFPRIEVGPDEGRFLRGVARAVGARNALEIGTLAGYSAAWIAGGLAPGGRLLSLEMDPEHAALARRLLTGADLGVTVEVREGRALDLLPNLAGEGPFDLVFIDADKPSYPAYLEHAIQLTRPGGAILAHNVFLGGDVVNPGDQTDASAMDAFNHRLAEDPRLVSTLVPLRDGMSFSIVQGATP